MKLLVLVWVVLLWILVVRVQLELLQLLLLLLLLLQLLLLQLLALLLGRAPRFFTIAAHVRLVLGLRRLFPLAFATALFLRACRVANIHQRCSAAIWPLRLLHADRQRLKLGQVAHRLLLDALGVAGARCKPRQPALASLSRL